MELNNIVGELFEQYRAFNQHNPITGSILTACAIFPTADIASQLITDKKVSWEKVRYTSLLSPFYGLGAHLCVRSADVVGKYISEHALAKAALGPNMLGLLFNLFFFVNNTVGEKTNYQLRELGRHYSSLFSSSSSSVEQGAAERNWYKLVKEKILDYVPRKEYLNSAIGTLTFWNAFQYVNYSYIPPELQTPATLGVAFGWTVLLSAWSLAGRTGITNNPGKNTE